MLTIYHNPRCSKSRETLEILRSSGSAPRVIEYLQEPPDAKRINAIAGMLKVPVADLLRRGETEFKEASDLPELDDDTALAAWISAHPRTLQRPIVVDDDRARAVIGRPPGNVRELMFS